MTIEIPLTQGKVAIIDDEDFELVSGYKWYASKGRNTFYAATKINVANGARSKVLMHRLLLGLTDPDIEGDHVDMDGLNNRRCNIRACSLGENQQNKGLQANNTSGFKGVYWSKNNGKWRAQIKAFGKRHHLGLFTSPEAAYAAYCKASRELHGEFSRLE